MKAVKIFILGMFFLVLTASFTLAAEETKAVDINNYPADSEEIPLAEVPSGTDIAPYISPDLEEEVVADNILLEKTAGVTTVTFKGTSSYLKAESSLKIGDLELTNVGSTKDTQSYLNFDSKGEITEADITIADSGSQDIIIEGKKITLQPRDHLVYKDGVLTITTHYSKDRQTVLPKFDEGEVILEGAGDVKLPDDKIVKLSKFKGGPLHYDGENLYIKPDSEIEYYKYDSLRNKDVRALTFNSKDRVNIYLDGEEHPGEAALSLGDKGFVLSCGDNSDIGSVSISYRDYYYDLLDSKGGSFKNSMKGSTITTQGDFAETRRNPDKSLELGLTEKDSSMIYSMPEKGGYFTVEHLEVPTINANKGYALKTGNLNIISKSGRTMKYSLENGEAKNSLEVVVVDSSNDKYDKAIQIGENSVIRIHFKEKAGDWKGLGMGDRETFFQAAHDKESKIFYKTYSSKMTQQFVKIRNSLVEDSEKLVTKLKTKYANDPRLNEFFSGERTLDSEVKIAEDVKDIFLNKKEMIEALGGEKEYNRFQTNFNLVSDMTYFKDVKGAKERGESEFKYGYRYNNFMTGLKRYSKSWSNAQSKLVKSGEYRYTTTPQGEGSSLSEGG